MRPSAASSETAAFAGLGFLCTTLSVALPASLLLFMVATIDNQIVPLVAAIAFLLFVNAALASRSDALSVAIAITGLAFALSDAGLVAMMLMGAGLFLTFVLHDLSLSVRRQPILAPEFIRGMAVSTAGVIGAGWLVTGVAVGVARLTLWPALVLPVAVIAIGLFVFLGLQQLIDHSDSSDVTPS